MEETLTPGRVRPGPDPEAAAYRADTGATQAFLEGYVRQRFLRELDDEETVIRSLPFYATGTGATFAAIAVAAPQLRQAPPGYAVPIAAAFAVDVALVAVSIACLLAALVRRGVLDVAPESELLRSTGQVAQETREQFADATPQELESIILARVRGSLIAQMIVATARNRVANRERKTWRNRAFVALVGALLLTIGGLVATFTAGGLG
ncbi:hypothetical protein [Muricoccus aerilatus]|uniref:hypothetical protein n=1 Tax=Muricoccus aerilatus TaxID=452982 RepID=UPI0012EBFA55|nr:hypothetical protein [Roseomonas aerilata]